MSANTYVRPSIRPQDITAEEQRHARQAEAMAAFCAAERDGVAAQFGKKAADAAVSSMKRRLERLKVLQVRSKLCGILYVLARSLILTQGRRSCPPWKGRCSMLITMEFS